MLSQAYIRTVQLMLRVAPDLCIGEVFALKGGSALNLYLSVMPRLSVDLDLVFLPVGLDRDEALSTIAAELERASARLVRSGLTVRPAVKTEHSEETKVIVGDGRVQVKIEVNRVFRGSLLSSVAADLHPAVQELFQTSAPARLLQEDEVLGSKMVAALDRQHPRDLFDIWFRGQPATQGAQEAFAVYLAGHNRPPHEVIDSRDRPLARTYESALLGMISGTAPTLSQLEATRARVRQEVRNLPAHVTSFLLGFFNLTPDWGLLESRSASQLPALQWKQKNLEVLRQRRRMEFERQLESVSALAREALQDYLRRAG